MNKTKKFLTLLLCAALLIGLVPYTAQEAQAADIQIQTGEPTFTVNQSVVAFAGHEWWVIGMTAETGQGVNTVEGTVTLLAKDYEFGDSAFREGKEDEFSNSKRYSGDGWWYATSWDNTPNEYAGSTLQKKLESITDDQTDPHFINSRESALIKARTINSGEGINGPSVSDQKLWALSKLEWETIKSLDKGTDVLKYVNGWWLRSPDSLATYAAFVYGDGSVTHTGDSVGLGSFAVRPALNLDLKSLLFTSDASDASGKSSAVVGKELASAEAATGTVKFTIKDTANQKLTVEATDEQKTQSNKSTLEFIYSGATYGTDQYISCVLTDSTQAVKYYGKLKQVDSAEKARGTMQIPLAGVGDGTYTLKIFSEQANGAKYTDFASEPVTMTVTVSDGKGKVSDYKGNDHTHSYVGGECTVCHATDSTFKPSITAGADSTWYKGSKTGLSITSDATIAHFQNVQVDGQDITQANYEVKEGSTIVTLKADYLESLSTGKHTVSIVSLTGTAGTSFIIAEKTDENEPNTNGGTTDGGQNQGNTNSPQTGGKNQGNTDNPQTGGKNQGNTNNLQTGGKNQGNITAPQTGDNSHMALWIALMLLSLAGIGGTVWHSRKTS